MAKTWEKMTAAEKIEDLRRDMKMTMQTLNAMADQMRRLGEFHNSLMKEHAETASRLSQVLISLRASSGKKA